MQINNDVEIEAYHKNIASSKSFNDQEAIELVLICAQDIVKAWPQTTMRTLAQMTKRIDTLRQALEAVKK